MDPKEAGYECMNWNQLTQHDEMSTVAESVVHCWVPTNYDIFRKKLENITLNKISSSERTFLVNYLANYVFYTQKQKTKKKKNETVGIRTKVLQGYC